MSQPKDTLERIQIFLRAWETIRPDKSFGGMTFAQFKAGVKNSLDIREELSVLESQTQSKKIERDASDKNSNRLMQLVVNGVVGDPEEGPDGELYEALGYTRKSVRKTGLTRKKNKNGGGTSDK